MVHRKKKKFAVFLWHRRAGLAAFVLLIILAVTGIMLNHTESLLLDETYIDSSLLLDWYGLEPKGDPVSYRAGAHNITQWDQQLFFDHKPVANTRQTLRGAVESERFIVVAFDSEFILLSPQGDIIERMPGGESFSNVQRIGIKFQRLVIETSEPLYFMADEQIIDWNAIGNENITWSQTVEPALKDKERLREAFRGKGLTLERITLDLHSGRILGQYGIYLMDAAAITLLWLSLSGLWVWWRRRVKQSQKRHYRKHHRV